MTKHISHPIIPHLIIPLLMTLALTPAQGCAQEESTRIRLGSEVLLEEELDLLHGKRVGLITNHTGALPEGGTLAGELVARGIRLVALFSPEHGFRGAADEGEAVGDSDDPLTGIPVYSLYGKTKKPTPEMLEGIDILLYDIQDVGARFYTYISTMGLAMEAAAEAGIPFVVLDRPNPLGGERIEGPVIEDSLRSFVGQYPVPVVYGLTCGELAQMMVGEQWMNIGTWTGLTVIPMNGWKREMLWDDTGLSWIRPSPNIPDPGTALIYPATCFIEATALSEGRGTSSPFRIIGAPFVSQHLLASTLTNARLPGVEVDPATFIPASSKHAGQGCEGVRMTVSHVSTFRPVAVGIRILVELRDTYQGRIGFDEQRLKRLLGASKAVEMLLGGAGWEEIASLLEVGVSDFRVLALKYRLYE